ncbi:hypothetical protein [Streptomyces sp. NPDC127197]|uniref:hypothetical protein n=1 Tax=Streptomyces sp. NPDC127197 TaxID=3345388 RepID=UPI003626CDB9
MTGERLPLDEFLERQNSEQETRLRVTIQPLPEQPDRVKVTPFVADARGCLCPYALAVDKSAIAEVITTDESRDCCGAQLAVVEVTFASDTLTDVFKQLVASAARATGRYGAPDPAPPPDPARQGPPVSPPQWRPPLPSARYGNASNWPVVGPFGEWYMLDPKSMATGRYRPVPDSAAWLQFRCSARYSMCLQACEGYWDPVAYAACQCRCGNDFATCLDPNAPTQPCG